jgi:hypothetical protein
LKVLVINGTYHLDPASLQYLRDYLYYTRVFEKKNDGTVVEKASMKYACVPFYSTMLRNRYFIISTRHGSHKCLEKGDEVNVYNVTHHQFNVKVVYCHDECDFILFESKVKLGDFMLDAGSINAGQQYAILVCFGSAYIKLCGVRTHSTFYWTFGCISIDGPFCD